MRTTQLKILSTAHVAWCSLERSEQLFGAIPSMKMLEQADIIASEMCSVYDKNPDIFYIISQLRALYFWAARTNVSLGDKVIGTNHTFHQKECPFYLADCG